LVELFPTQDDMAEPARFPKPESARTERQRLSRTDSRTSEVIAAFRDDLPEGRVTLGDLIAALGDRSFGSIMLALSIPTIMPVPLGVSVLCDLPILIFSGQLALGRGAVELPRWLLRRSVKRDTAARLLDAVLPRIRWLERVLKPRLLHLTTPERERWLGVICFLLTAIAIVPLPLTGWLPGFALVLISLGLVERDGAAVAIGLGLGVAAVAVAFAVVTSLAYAGTLLLAGGPSG